MLATAGWDEIPAFVVHVNAGIACQPTKLLSVESQ